MPQLYPTKLLCLSAPRGAPDSLADALRDAAAVLARETPALARLLHFRVLRHIPTDSVNADRSHAGVTPEADAIQGVLELHFHSRYAPGDIEQLAAWQAFRERVQACAPILFSLDAASNVPIAPRGAARDGGFRRWMLLARKAPTQAQFRDAWFGRHADLVSRLPGVDGYMQDLVTARRDAQGREVDDEAMPIDGVAQLCFADEAAMNATYASEARLPLRDDGRELLGRISTLIVHGEVLA